MAEQDRLAALLERATRERRGGDPDEWPGGGADQFGHTRDDTDRPPQALGDPTVHGGQWLPEDPAVGRHRPGEGRPRLLTIPESLRAVNIAVRPAAIVGVIVVVLLAGGILGVRWWLAQEGSQPVPVAPLAPGPRPVAAGESGPGQAPGVPAAGPEATAGPVADGSSTTAVQPPQQLLVHVDGQVRSPGVVRVEPGARVLDAVTAAGGLTGDADTSRLNLARPVADGERLWVPRPGEEVPDVADGAAAGVAGPLGGSSSVAGGAELQVNLNTADQAALEELPGVGPVTAAAIVQWRTDHGRFTHPDELLEVSGIGEATLEKLRAHVTL